MEVFRRVTSSSSTGTVDRRRALRPLERLGEQRREPWWSPPGRARTCRTTRCGRSAARWSRPRAVSVPSASTTTAPEPSIEPASASGAEVQRHVEMLGAEEVRGRATGLHCAERSASGDTAREVEQIADGRAHRHAVDPGLLHVTGHGEELQPARCPRRPGPATTAAPRARRSRVRRRRSRRSSSASADPTGRRRRGTAACCAARPGGPPCTRAARSPRRGCSRPGR